MARDTSSNQSGNLLYLFKKKKRIGEDVSLSGEQNIWYETECFWYIFCYEFKQVKYQVNNSNCEA